MANLPEDRSESTFADFKPAWDANQAVAEANRCLYCLDAPCITACPTSIDIPTFIRKISTGNVKGSAKTILDANILGMSCARVCPVETLCVGDCVFNHMDQPPIQIGKLQRYATDVAYDEGWQYYEAGPDTGKSVGLVGGGPATLAAAHWLRRQGHACTIYEKRDVLGGLNTWGVAPYKMRADRAIEEVDWLLQIGGIDLKTGVTVGVDIDFAGIEAAHDAVFLGFGLGLDRALPVPGSDLAGIVGAVDYIEQFKLGTVPLDGVREAVVVGGGNTAIDAVRELLGLGVPNVTMLYRGTEAKMSGYQHEWKAAKVEGAHALWHHQPIGYEGDGTVSGIRCSLLGADKKPIEGAEATIPAQLVLLAIGQGKLGDLVEALDGIETKWGCVVVDAEQATGRRGWWAGGDCANGGKEVVNAAAEGKVAAKAIDAFLREDG